MGSLTNAGESAVIQHLTREAAHTPAATIYVALCTADPTDAATGASMNEVANTGNYQRTAITFGAAASRRVTQSGTVTFPALTGALGTTTHWALVTSQTYGSGTVLAHGAWNEGKALVSGNTPSFSSGSIYVELTDTSGSGYGLSNYAANGMLDRMFRNQAFTISANHLGVSTTTLTNTTTGSTVGDPAGGSYARLAINPQGGAQPSWGAETGGSASNANGWSLPTATASWGTIVSSYIADAASAGNILMYDNANVVDQLVGTDDTVTFPTGTFTVSLT